MTSLNSCLLIGHLGRDPELITFQSGDAILNLDLATSESWLDKASNQRKSKTHWHKIVIKNKNVLAFIHKYAKKGNLLSVQGKIEYRQFDANGVKKVQTEIVVAPFFGDVLILDKTQKSQVDPHIFTVLTDEKKQDNLFPNPESQFGYPAKIDPSPKTFHDDEIPF